VLGNPTTENPNLAELSYAAQEAQAVAELFGVQPSLEDQATEQVVKSQSSSAGILHLAAHGSLNPYTPLFSRLWLTPQGEEDGRLNVYEIYSLNLSKVNLVVLSACQTQLGEVSAGDEIVSLNRAFLYSTPTVVASLWSVDDEASGYFMEQFYKNLIQGGSKAQALQNAQAAVRENTDHPEWQHPYYWASFVLNGDPSSGSIMTSQNGQNPTPPEFQMPSLYKIGAVVLVTLLLLILLVTYLKKR